MRCTTGSLLVGLHLVDVGLRDAVLLGLDQREDHPLGDGEELVVAAAHGRAERLLGDQLGQDHVVFGVARFLVAHRRQARGVGGVGLAAAGEVGALLVASCFSNTTGFMSRLLALASSR